MKRLTMTAVIGSALVVGFGMLPDHASAAGQADQAAICEQTECPNSSTQVCAIVTVPLPAPAEGTIAYNCFQPIRP